MSHDPLIVRADAAIESAHSLHVDRRAIRDDAEAARDTLRETLLGSMIVTDQSATARLIRRSEGLPWKTSK
jgi:hypothetical protein